VQTKNNELSSAERAWWDVLVVDDEQVVRAGVRDVLEADGLRVGTAKDSVSALAHPALNICRLVLCDLVLADDSGLELISRLKQIRPQLLVIAITGFATREQRTRARSAGADGFLAKPFDESELIGVVRAALESVERAKEEERS
jgi:DNA-binding NtrC family response regulator